MNRVMRNNHYFFFHEITFFDHTIQPVVKYFFFFRDFTFS